MIIRSMARIECPVRRPVNISTAWRRNIDQMAGAGEDLELIPLLTLTEFLRVEVSLKIR